MRLSTLLFVVFRFLLPPAIIATLLLYLYPVAQQCSFPTPTSTSTPAPAPAPAFSTQPSRPDVCLLDSLSPLTQRQGRLHKDEEHPQNDTTAPVALPSIAPFRLLALGDPQLEGSTSLPPPDAPTFPSLAHLSRSLHTHPLQLAELPHLFRAAIRDLALKDIPALLQTYRKRLDLWGNDLYLAHIYRHTKWWTHPTHTVVLGDLLGSQWIPDPEFDRRTQRFWHRVFAGGQMVDEAIMWPQGHHTGLGGHDPQEEPSLNHDDRFKGEEIGAAGYDAWRDRIIAVAGNHDVGYAGDLDKGRIHRFERAFGRVNWRYKFWMPPTAIGSSDVPADKEPVDDPIDPLASLDPPPTLDLVILNSMNLDGPAWDSDLRAESWDFLESTIAHLHEKGTDHRRGQATILLTHIPLYKEAGICVDAPFFSYFPEQYHGGIREQNHLSQNTSARILDGLFAGLQTGQEEVISNGIILNGHDHEGCDVWHQYQRNPATPAQAAAAAAAAASSATLSSSPIDGDAEPETKVADQQPHTDTHPPWTASRYRGISNQQPAPGIREVTVRSMMGSYHGNAGLLSAWLDPNTQEWRFDYATCVLGVQHLWWGVHVLDLVVLALGFGALAFHILETLAGGGEGVESAQSKNTKASVAKASVVEPKQDLDGSTGCEVEKVSPSGLDRRRG